MYRKKAMEAIKEKDILLAEATSAAQSEGLRRSVRGGLNGSAAFGQVGNLRTFVTYAQQAGLRLLTYMGASDGSRRPSRTRGCST